MSSDWLAKIALTMAATACPVHELPCCFITYLVLGTAVHLLRQDF